MPVESVLSVMEKSCNMECGIFFWFKDYRQYLRACMCVFRLEELLKAFLDDPDPDVTVSLGPDMRKIHYCFSLLKVIHLQYLHAPCVTPYLCYSLYPSIISLFFPLLSMTRSTGRHHAGVAAEDIFSSVCYASSMN